MSLTISQRMRRLRARAARWGCRLLGWEPCHVVLRDLFRTRAIDLVLDVGANRGQYAGGLRDAGYDGEIISFEPIVEHAESIWQRARADGGWSVHGVALGASPGSARLHLASEDQFSSFRATSSYGQGRYGGLMAASAEREVPVHRLDQLLPTLIPDASSRRIHLKVDTQGFDLEVLRGAGVWLERIATLQVEIPFLRIYEGVPPYYDHFEFLHAAGFDLCGVYSIAGRDRQRLVEADCLFVRRPAG